MKCADFRGGSVRPARTSSQKLREFLLAPRNSLWNSTRGSLCWARCNGRETVSLLRGGEDVAVDQEVRGRRHLIGAAVLRVGEHRLDRTTEIAAHRVDLFARHLMDALRLGARGRVGAREGHDATDRDGRARCLCAVIDFRERGSAGRERADTGKRPAPFRKLGCELMTPRLGLISFRCEPNDLTIRCPPGFAPAGPCLPKFAVLDWVYVFFF